MDEQMSIFDFIEPPATDLETLSESDMIEIISKSTGLDFKFNSFYSDYRCNYKGIEFTCHYSHYTVPPYTRFISCGYWNRQEQCGSGGPYDSLDAAIKFFNKRKGD